MDQILVLRRKNKAVTIAEIIGQELKVMEVVAESFMRWRVEAGVSLTEIEQKTGVPVSLLQAWELGTISPMASSFYEVVAFLGEEFLFQAGMQMTELNMRANEIRKSLEAASGEIERVNFEALGAVRPIAA
jgi:transcriptional regulator with XRE-family HTH domain